MKKTLLIVGVFLLGQLVAGAILAIAFAARASSQGADMAADYVPPLYDMLVALMVSDIIIIVATCNVHKVFKFIIILQIRIIN